MGSNLENAGLYAIADLDLLGLRSISLVQFAEDLRAAGVTLVQLRAKSQSPAGILAAAAVLRSVFPHPEALLIMNDRVDLALLANFDVVHVGQGDLAVEDVRQVLRESARIGSATRLIGLSTHTDEQVRQAERSTADYIAIGPVFATGTKLDTAPPVGLEGVRQARALTSKPLVAIGGITRENAVSVRAAGACSVAVISGLLAPGDSVEKVARDFLEIFR